MTSHKLDSFQTELLADLKQHVAVQQDAASVIRLDEKRRSSRTVRKVAWIGGIAAAGVAALTVIPNLGSSPAYAVTAGSHGVVHVKINRLEKAPELQEELKKRGINADIRYLPVGMQCAPDRFTPMSSAKDSATTFIAGSVGIDAVIDRRDVPAGATVVISVAPLRAQPGISAHIGIAKGPVKACVVQPEPAA